MIKYAEIPPISKKKKCLVLISPSSHHLNILFPFEGNTWKEFSIPIVCNFPLLILSSTHANRTFVLVTWLNKLSSESPVSSKLLNPQSTQASSYLTYQLHVTGHHSSLTFSSLGFRDIKPSHFPPKSLAALPHWFLLFLANPKHWVTPGNSHQSSSLFHVYHFLG